MRVLVYELDTRTPIARVLRGAALAVDATATRRDAVWLAGQNPYDAIVLDSSSASAEATADLAPVRAASPSAAILAVVATGSAALRAHLLDAGADDCLTRPFELSEVLARVRALIRRKYRAPNPMIVVADLVIDSARREVSRGGERIALTGREYALLEYLALRTGELVTRTQIWEHVYSFDAEPHSNVIDVYLGSLRKKLESAGRPRLIHTRRGQGVTFGL